MNRVKRAKIRIIENGTPGFCNVSVNGKEINGVKAYCIEHEAMSLAELTLYAFADTVIEETGNVEWVAIPQTIDEAKEVLRIAALKGELDVEDTVEFFKTIVRMLAKEDE